MTLQEKKQELIAAVFVQPPCTHPSGVTDEYGTLCDACDFEYEKSLRERVSAFADALLEEACKAVCPYCAPSNKRWQTATFNETFGYWVHISTSAGEGDCLCRASAIRSGKGK